MAFSDILVAPVIPAVSLNLLFLHSYSFFVALFHLHRSLVIKHWLPLLHVCSKLDNWFPSSELVVISWVNKRTFLYGYSMR